MMNTQLTYEAPKIVFEGDLEIQAGSPLRITDPTELEELNW